MIKVIKNDEQYERYCNMHKEIIESQNKYDGEPTQFEQDLIDILTLVIKDYDERNKPSTWFDPVQLILSIMDDHELTVNDLCLEIDYINVYYVQELLKYKVRPKQEFIDKFSERFKIQQSALKQQYRLDGEYIC